MHNEIPAYMIDDNICGIELPAHLGRAVSEFLRANRLPGPTIEMVGGRQIHIATAPDRALRALDSLERCGAKVHRGNAKLALRNSKMTVQNLEEIPAVVVIAAAVRAVTRGRGPTTQKQAIA